MVAAALGTNPTVTQWESSHGSGGGIEDMFFRVQNAGKLWEKALVLISD